MYKCYNIHTFNRVDSYTIMPFNNLVQPEATCVNLMHMYFTGT